MTVTTLRQERQLRATGYTLIELTLVLVLIGLIASMAMWRIAPSLERARVRRTASVLAADLQYAQMIAARQRQPVVVLLNPSLKMYMVRDRSGTTVYRERWVGPDTDYGVQSLTASPTTSVEIFPNGVATQTVTFTATINNHQRQVKLSRAGQIRILVP